MLHLIKNEILNNAKEDTNQRFESWHLTADRAVARGYVRLFLGVAGFIFQNRMWVAYRAMWRSRQSLARQMPQIREEGDE